MRIRRIAKYSKAQIKIQQTAFMLVAVMIFFGMVALIYFSISLSNIKQEAGELSDAEAQEIAQQLSGTPELAFTAGSSCASCIDIHKAFALSEIEGYGKSLWNLDYLMIEQIYPEPSEGACTEMNLGNCKTITLIKLPRGREISGTKTAFVSLVVWDPNLGGIGGYRYNFGKIHALAKELNGK